MAAATARALRPEKRETRAVATARAPKTHDNNSTNTDSENGPRLQRLARDFALFGPLAETVALLAWGVPHHG